MTDRLIIADARTVDPVDFFRAVTGKPPMSAVEKAERQARAARMRLIDTIERVEFARARREREAMIREHCVNGSREGETYEQYIERTNRPFTEARERVTARIAEFEEQRKAA